MIDSRSGSVQRKVCVVTTLDLDGIRREFDFLYEDPDLYISKSPDDADFYLVDVSHPIDDLDLTLLQGNYATDTLVCKPVLLASTASGDEDKDRQPVVAEQLLKCSLPVHRGKTEVRPALDRFKRFVFPARKTVGGRMTQIELARMAVAVQRREAS